MKGVCARFFGDQKDSQSRTWSTRSQDLRQLHSGSKLRSTQTGGAAVWELRSSSATWAGQLGASEGAMAINGTVAWRGTLSKC